MNKEKFELEYLINASPRLIYNNLSTASGMAEWFAEDVNIRNGIYCFEWEGGGEEEAKVLTKKKDEYIRFKWLESEGDDSYFEMRIRIDDMTGELALIVTDFAEEDEVEDSKLLWDRLIDRLRQSLGC
jgi:uncharacterized protein YndB with AHSA1/START domain